MSDPLIDLLKDDPNKPVMTAETLLGVLRKGPATLRHLGEHFGELTSAVDGLLCDLRAHGSNVHLFGEHWSLAKQPAPAANDYIYTSRADNTYVFGVSSDQHLGSKYERLDLLNESYDWFASRGVDRVFNCGNWIDGHDEKNQHDIAVHGLEPQIDYLVANYPKRHLPAPFGMLAGETELKTYAVWGEDHEGWFARRESIDVGRFVERKMREAGRTDWHDLGFMEAAVTLRNANSGVEAPPLVAMHPGGGTAYALSYRPQKLVESLQGGQKPSVLLIGHYHKMSVNLIRSVWAIQVGCTQDQTPFMRKIPTEPHLGAFIITLHQDPQTGAITGCDTQMRQYFDKSYTNGRWSKSGPAVQSEKFMIGPKA